MSGRAPTYRGFICAGAASSITSPADFQRKVLWASARDPEARAAMLAWREARSLALNAPAKLPLLEEIVRAARGERVLVFSEYNALVDEVSARFCIPQITHQDAGRGAPVDPGALPRRGVTPSW